MSKSITVQLYGAAGNNAVVKLPERRNAGIVVQADTLRALAVDARAIAEHLGMSAVDTDLLDDALVLAETLEEMFENLKSEIELAGETLAV